MKHVRVVINYKSNLQYRKAVLIFCCRIDVIKLQFIIVRPHKCQRLHRLSSRLSSADQLEIRKVGVTR